MSEKNVLAPCRPVLFMVAVFSFFANLLMLTVPLYMLQLFDRVLSSRSEETLVMLTVVAVGALVVLGILEAVRARLQVRIGTWMSRALGPPLLSASVQRALLANETPNVQGLRDLSRLRNFLSGAGVFHLFDMPWVPLYVGVIFLLHPWLGAIAAGGAVLLFLIALANELATRNSLQAASSRSVRLLEQSEANVRNASVIEAMGMMPNLLTSWRRDNEEVLDLHRIASDRAGLINAVTRFLRPAVQIAVLAAGVYLAMRGEITPGAMIVAAIILSRALAPAEQMIGTWKSFVAARQAYGRIKHTLANPVVQRGTMRLSPSRGRLTVEDVTLYAPGGETPVLQDIRLAIEPGECLGVIGPTAAGKSSLARLLVGIWPARYGAARLDDADLFTWNREDLGPHIGYLPQNADLFAGSIRRNIARMGEPDDEAVVAASQLAGVHDMILHLPMGYDTEIGEGGMTLSGGQRQRIALARALYGQPQLLVLDEPNANLDAEGEAVLMSALSHARRMGITAVVIAHRFGILAAADKILLLRNGRMAGYGQREKIIATFFPHRVGQQEKLQVGDRRRQAE